MADINLKTLSPDGSLPTTGFLFGADSQASTNPSVYTVQGVATTLLGSTTLNGATVTTSQPVLNLTQTWNAGAVTFNGLLFNVTDTASAAASLLMDLQVGTVSQASFDKRGTLSFAAASFAPTPNRPAIGNWNNSLGLFGSSGVLAAAIGNGNFNLVSSYSLAWNTDLFITRRGAANIRLGAADAAAPVAQTLSVQSVVAGTSNTAGADLIITGSQGTGTGQGGSIIFQVATAGASGTAQNALAAALTISGAKNLTSAGTGTFNGGALTVSDGSTSFLAVTSTVTGNLLEVVNSSVVTVFAVTTTGATTWADAANLAFGTSTGTKIGTATSQKLGFWNATPIVQPTTAVTAATVAATGTGDVVAASTTFDGYTIPQVVKALRNAGLLA